MREFHGGDCPQVLEEAGKRGIPLSPSRIELLCGFARMAADRGILLGLSGRKNLEEVIRKDVLDSLLLVPHLNPPGTLPESIAKLDVPRIKEVSPAPLKARNLLDIGSGAGFPGIPLKIALPGLEVVLLEAKKKAVQFLKEVRNRLDLDFEIWEGRAEENRSNPRLRGRFDAVTARAVAPLKTFLPWGVEFLSPGGKIILQKGKKWEEELAEAAPFLEKRRLSVDSIYPGLEGGQRILVLKSST